MIETQETQAINKLIERVDVLIEKQQVANEIALMQFRYMEVSLPDHSL